MFFQFHNSFKRIDPKWLVQKKQEGGILGGSLSCNGSGKEPLFEAMYHLYRYGKANNLDSGNTFLWNQPID
jgi:hypothetical protein